MLLLETLPRLNTGFSILPRFFTPVFGKIGVKTRLRGIPRFNLDLGPFSSPRPRRGKNPDFFFRPRPRRGKNPGRKLNLDPREVKTPQTFFDLDLGEVNYLGIIFDLDPDEVITSPNIFDLDLGEVGRGFYLGGKKSGFTSFDLDLGKTLHQCLCLPKAELN